MKIKQSEEMKLPPEVKVADLKVVKTKAQPKESESKASRTHRPEGGYKKGISGNPVGRPKGSKDKVTTKAKEAYAMFLENNMDNFQGWIDRVAANNPAKALEIMIKLTNYVIPIMNSNSVTVRDTREEIDYSKLSKEELENLWNK